MRVDPDTNFLDIAPLAAYEVHKACDVIDAGARVSGDECL